MAQPDSHFKLGSYSSFTTAVLAGITFAIAVFTPPMSGPFCESSCFQYPYTGIIGRFPRDYYWMYAAMVLLLFYLTMMICIHHTSGADKRHFSLLGVAFASMSALILFTNYFIQVSVIQPSLLSGETDGIPILSQFNPHGIFIALEELGFFFMIISLFFLGPVFSGSGAHQKAIKWTSVTGFLFTVFAFLFITFKYGINREYRFEVAVISIACTELIILGLLLTRHFRVSRF